MVQREDDILKFFNYEMTLFPTSLFKDGMMRKPDKPALRKHLIDGKVPESFRYQKHVLDGGALLHKVRWVKGKTYAETFTLYAEYVKKNYGAACTIVFDGYGNPSTTTGPRTSETGVFSQDISEHTSH